MLLKNKTIIAPPSHKPFVQSEEYGKKKMSAFYVPSINTRSDPETIAQDLAQLRFSKLKQPYTRANTFILQQ